MGSFGMSMWTRCPCGRSTWPLESTHCAACLAEAHTRSILLAVSRRHPLAEALNLGVVECLVMVPGSYWHSSWRAQYVGWILLSRGSPLRQFTYFYGGLAGSVDQHTDVLDLIIEGLTSPRAALHCV